MRFSILCFFVLISLCPIAVPSAVVGNFASVEDAISTSDKSVDPIGEKENLPSDKMEKIAVEKSVADCINTQEGGVECSKETSIFLDNSKSSSAGTTIDLSQMDFDEPKECGTTFCYKESAITIKVKKTRKPIDKVINNKSLKSRIFAKDFPYISTKQSISNQSPVVDRFVLQKVLYERGLLDSEPTGKIGYLTELAVMKLQCIKGYQEYDKNKTMFVIGPKTISDINKIKDKMKDPNYLRKTNLPNIDLNKCGEVFRERSESLNKLLGNPPTWANNTYSNTGAPSYSFELGGEVKIQKK